MRLSGAPVPTPCTKRTDGQTREGCLVQEAVQPVQRLCNPHAAKVKIALCRPLHDRPRYIYAGLWQWRGRPPPSAPISSSDTLILIEPSATSTSVSASGSDSTSRGWADAANPHHVAALQLPWSTEDALRLPSTLATAAPASPSRPPASARVAWVLALALALPRQARASERCAPPRASVATPPPPSTEAPDGPPQSSCPSHAPRSASLASSS